MHPRLSTKRLLQLASLLVVGLCCAAPRLAAAAPENPDDGCLSDPVCRGHYEQAVALFEQGRFDAALSEFQAAYMQRQMPWLLINMGRTLHRLGKPKEALEQYDLYTKAESRIDPETRQRLDKYVAQAQAQAQTQPADPAPAITPVPSGTPDKSSQPRPSDKPLYKKWWFWTAIGGAAAVVIVTGVAIGVTAGRSSSLPSDVMVYRPAF